MCLLSIYVDDRPVEYIWIYLNRLVLRCFIMLYRVERVVNLVVHLAITDSNGHNINFWNPNLKVPYDLRTGRYKCICLIIGALIQYRISLLCTSRYIYIYLFYNLQFVFTYNQSHKYNNWPESYFCPFQFDTNLYEYIEHTDCLSVQWLPNILINNENKSKNYLALKKGNTEFISKYSITSSKQ